MRETWTKNEIMWPRDLLPRDVPESRVFLFGYDAGITHRDQSRVAKTEIHSDADDLCAKLAAKRTSSNTVSIAPARLPSLCISALTASIEARTIVPSSSSPIASAGLLPPRLSSTASRGRRVPTRHPSPSTSAG